MINDQIRHDLKSSATVLMSHHFPSRGSTSGVVYRIKSCIGPVNRKKNGNK